MVSADVNDTKREYVRFHLYSLYESRGDISILRTVLTVLG